MLTSSTSWNAGQPPPTTKVCGFRLPQMGNLQLPPTYQPPLKLQHNPPGVMYSFGVAKRGFGHERFDPGYSGTTRDILDARLSRAQRLTGRATALGRAEARSDVRLLRERCPGWLLPTYTPDQGTRLARRSPGHQARRPAPAASGLPVLLPRPLKAPVNTTRKTRVSPERSRSASTGRAGWRRGQARANPSRCKCPAARRWRTKDECGMDHGKSRNIPDQVFDRRQAGRKVTARQSRASHLIPAMSRNIPDRNFDRGYRGPRGPRAEWCRWRLPRRLWRARHQPACAEHASVSRAVGAAVVTASGPWLGPCGASWDARSASCSAAFSPLIFLPCYPFHLTTRR